MEIVNFFEKLAGRWFSQRTTHALSTQQSKAGKSDLEVAFLASDADEVRSLCESLERGDDSQAEPLCGLQVQQSSTVEGDTKPSVLTTLMVPFVPDSPTSSRGRLVSSGGPGQGVKKSTYTLEDDVLTIVTEDDQAQSTERVWFINDNLRMRTGMTELADGLRIASFCSEIRLGVKPPKTD
ncbi:phycobiliprotein lyase [cf. Phormidesmis sp. LEGE 11477]|uniref:phycobiliprotein lyase n=1 Tax=cf. Phormidesmis sp. LEGE 11477 TaxID=1828680 RepID=UPI0018817D03|nr:phycobiliprotein lyase [cf. Phormidesmis sp. LEGE 11477]MBE9060997.1 phycobiliprotein lyase [cf. Phormidesmis sp. LEGE 11477]